MMCASKRSRFLCMMVIAFFSFSIPGFVYSAEIPSIESVIKGEAKLPTITELTDGKVKQGDLIDKSNVDTVKEFIPAGIYQMVKKGMVLRIGSPIPPNEIIADYFKKVTEKNFGKAVMDEAGVTYYEKVGGAMWPGGVPFPNPQTGLEAMANTKYGLPFAEQFFSSSMRFVNSEGKEYKNVGIDYRILNLNCRTSMEPYGTWPGFENTMTKKISLFMSPRRLRGMGQYRVRHYDDFNNADTGFTYLPDFNRAIRITTTTYQDNVAGSDQTYGDSYCFDEPFPLWKFKILDKKYMLYIEPKSPFDIVDCNNNPDKKLEFDENKKFLRLGWCIWPTIVVEATPGYSHIYGKKVIYQNFYPYYRPSSPNMYADIYDAQMQLWKFYLLWTGDYHVNEKGEPQVRNFGTQMYDIQADHATNMYLNQRFDAENWKPEDLTYDQMLTMGGR